MNYKPTLFEIFLLQLVLYSAVFLWNDHIGFLLCVIFSLISLTLVIISHLIELVERSKVPVWYYKVMWITTVSPWIVVFFFSFLGELTFLSP